MQQPPASSTRSSRRTRLGAGALAAAALAAVAILGSGTWAQRAAQTDGPPNYDIRREKTAGASDYLSRFSAPPTALSWSADRAASLADLQKAVPDVNVEINTDMGTPEVVSADRFGSRLTSASADRLGTLRAFMQQYAGVYGLTASQVDELVPVADYMNPNGNMGWAELEQRVNGIPVFQGLIRGGFTAAGELVRTTGPLAARLDAGALSTAPSLGAAAALSRAATSVSWNYPEASFKASGTDEAGRTRFALGLQPHFATTWLVYFPLSPGIARLAWATEMLGNPDGYLTLLDAEDGTLLFRKNLTNYQTQSATYHVYPSDSPAPMSPGTNGPTGAQAPLVARIPFTLIGNEGPLSFNSLGWMTDGLNETTGNNVQSGLDLDAVDGIDAGTVAIGAGRVFNFAYNPGPGSPAPGESPTSPAYRNGEVTNMFYWTNWYHDQLYLLGFTEAARNFQTDNFGRGGVANDRVRAEGQDSSGTNNANFLTPADGTSGRMQMFIFTGPTPDYTSGLDQEIVIHELTHGTSNRLHNNGSGLNATMSGGMGEGWSDFYARALLSTPDEDVNGLYATGGYATHQITSGFVDNYYYGIRRFPYTVRSNVGSNGRPHSPQTFADIDGAQLNLNDGAFPRGPIGSGTAFQVHNIGEIWAAALFEVRARFINRLGHAVGNQRILQFVTDGMKLDPVAPTLLQGRNSIIAAANAGGGTAVDVADIWAGFATRGMGVSAQAASSSSQTVVEAFDVPGISANGGAVTAESIPNGRLDPGETVTVSLCMTNSGTTASGTVIGTLKAGGGVQSPSIAQDYGSVPVAGNICRSFMFVVGADCGAIVTATVQAQEVGGITKDLTYTFPTGTAAAFFSQAFDGVTAPTLPAGWTSVLLSGGANAWSTNVSGPDTAPNKAFVADPTIVTDNALVSPSVAVPAGPSVLTFRHSYATEAGWDGGVLEIAIGGGAFSDIITAGGTFITGAYVGPLTSSGNPLGGRPAWHGSSGGYVTTTVSMPSAAAGQNVVLRWRMGTDSSIGATGWSVDTIAISQFACSLAAPVITTHPQSQTVMFGNNTTLSVVAAGSAPLGYQWYQGPAGDTSNPIGINTPTLTTPAIAGPVSFWVRVSNGGGPTDSAAALITLGPPANVDMVFNGDFSSGTTNWQVFELPDIVSSVAGGVFQFYRANPTTTASGQATVFQNTGQRVAPNTPLRAQFDIGNSSTARKRISVLLIDSDFSEITVCTFWLAPGAPLRTYTMRTHTIRSWGSAAIYFYAATKGQDGGNYLLDNVSLRYDPAVSTTQTDCIDPTAPVPPGGSAGPNLLSNGNFGSGLGGWGPFGNLFYQVAGGIFEFFRYAPAQPAGGVLQSTGQAVATNEILTATFQLGNTSPVKKRVTVLLHDLSFTDLMACTFTLPPGQALKTYTMRGWATSPWANATLSVYAATIGGDIWIQLDNATLARTPSQAVGGTQCLE